MNIHLGFEIGTGRKVEIPLGHTVVTGQTQDSGKTTTQEALIVRSGIRAVAFITKRGEESFRITHPIPPFFKERVDWQFVAAILEATLSERMKFQRSWIMKVCQAHHSKDGQWPAPKTLADVSTNVNIALVKARGLNESVYTELREYLKIVVPQIEKLPYSSELVLTPGLNVMDLTPYSTEVQGLVIQSVLFQVLRHEREVVCIVPEAWKFIPQKHGSPVLRAAEQYVREGGVLKNFLWLDSQDIAGVSKDILRQMKVWILGVQREIHEVQRSLDHIPADVRKPKAGDLQRLGKGQFFVSYGQTLEKVYVQPAWMKSDLHAQAIARGEEKVETAREILKDWDRKEAAEAKRRAELAPQQTLEQLAAENPPVDLPPVVAEPLKHPPSKEVLFGDEPCPPQPDRTSVKIDGENEDAMYKEKWEESERQLTIANRRIEALEAQLGLNHKSPIAQSPNSSGIVEVAEDVYAAIVKRLRAEAPALVKLLAESPELEVSVQRPVVQVGTAEIYGKCVALAGNGFFKAARTPQEIIKELSRRFAVSPKTPLARVTIPMDKLTEMGIFFREGESYVLNPAAKVTVKEI